MEHGILVRSLLRSAIRIRARSLVLSLLVAVPLRAQPANPRVAPSPAAVAPRVSASLRAGALPPSLRLDGRLDEAVWATVDSIDGLTEVEPVVGRTPLARTVVKVLADGDRLLIGVRADDPEPSGIVAFARERDASLANEDHIKLVFDTFRDGRSGYVFAVNAHGARYDALIADQGNSENANWDAVWDAHAVRTPSGWSAEFEIPVRSLQFGGGQSTWGFNVQRRIQRRLETDRWASPVRDFKITQMFRAGALTDLPPFVLGIGLQVRP
jgi:hypothetical protein